MRGGFATGTRSRSRPPSRPDHAGSDRLLTLTVVFEFDNNGTFNPGNTAIRYQNDDTAEDIALAIFQALDADRVLGLAPQYLGDRVHIGSRGDAHRWMSPRTAS